MTLIPSQFVHVIPFGTSEPQQFGLRHNNGDPIDGTGIDVELEIYEKVDDVWTLIEDTPPTVGWLGTPSDGNVTVTGVDTLAVGNYRVRFKFTDTNDDIGYCPNGEKADLWKVVAIAN